MIQIILKGIFLNIKNKLIYTININYYNNYYFIIRNKFIIYIIY